MHNRRPRHQAGLGCLADHFLGPRQGRHFRSGRAPRPLAVSRDVRVPVVGLHLNSGLSLLLASILTDNRYSINTNIHNFRTPPFHKIPARDRIKQFSIFWMYDIPDNRSLGFHGV
jgi:hypothetical protein